ncbi:hypothetical protein [Azospirillum sp. sgz301742]
MNADWIAGAALGFAVLGLVGCSDNADFGRAAWPAQHAVPLVLEPYGPIQTTDAQGCRVPVLVENESNAPIQRLGLTAQARGADGRFLEEQRFDATREPVIDRLFFQAALRFTPATCRDMRSVVITQLTCGGTDGPAGPCPQPLELVDGSVGRIRFRLR